jgi:hypothetical protein
LDRDNNVDLPKGKQKWQQQQLQDHQIVVKITISEFNDFVNFRLTIMLIAMGAIAKEMSRTAKNNDTYGSLTFSTRFRIKLARFYLKKYFKKHAILMQNCVRNAQM